MSDHKSRQSARIIEAALHVIHVEGLSRVSISKVAARAGVTRQTIYNYFPDVESILVQVLSEHSASMEEHLLAVIGGAKGFRGKVQAFAAFQIEHVGPEHQNFGLESGLSAELRTQVATHHDKVKAALRRAVVSGLAEGGVARDFSPGVATEILWGLVEGALGAASKYPTQKPQILKAVVKAMIAAIA